MRDRIPLVIVILWTPIRTRVGAPQGCISSPVLFTLYTSDCNTCQSNQFLLKYSDDSTLISLMSDSDDPIQYQHSSVNRLVEWCDKNNLIINTKKTEDIIFGPAPGALTDTIGDDSWFSHWTSSILQISRGHDWRQSNIVLSYLRHCSRNHWKYSVSETVE